MSAVDRFVEIALGEVGKPYETHRDCSGFTAWAARQVGLIIPEGSVAQFSVGERAEPWTSEPGLLHFWDTFGPAPGHVAIDIGNFEVVHALNEQRGIVTSLLSGNMGGPYMGARRIFTDDISPSPTPDKPRKEQRKREKDRQRRRRRKG